MYKLRSHNISKDKEKKRLMSHEIGLDMYTYMLGENDIQGMLTTASKINIHTTRKMYTDNY